MLATSVMIENNTLSSTTACPLPNGDPLGHRATTARQASGLPGTSSTIRTSPLWDALPELAGLILACDCPMDQLREADILIGLFFDATTPDGDPASRGVDGKWSRTVALLQGIQALPTGVAFPMMSQEALVLAFCKLFPEHWFKNSKFTMVEDLINSPPFCSYSAWLAERGEAWDGPLVPHLAAGAVRQLARIGDGCQVGAMTHRATPTTTAALQLGPRCPFRTSIATGATTIALRRLTCVRP